ncbi:MAG: LPS export ABC transporter ATP-binding protein [Gammaproteobacteria bacterium]|nr:MAG: LPS export ABC transporter ATP-binding protein [Gammaproteobacteria bacterium]
MTRLVAEHLYKRYGERAVVKDVSLYVEGGEVVGLLGPNGAGKTTSFYMIAGLLPPGHGHIEMDGRDVTDYPLHGRARLGLGYLPQEASIFRKLTVEENILAVLELRSDLSRHQRRQQLEDLLDELRIAHLRSHRGMSLSGGERRRAEIARALAIRPHFMLLDEPFAGVDPLSVLDIQQIIAYLRNLGIGVLVTDHNVRETLSICDRAYILNEGEILAEGPPEDILTHPKVREVYLGHHFRL